MARILRQPEGELHTVSCDHGCRGAKCEGREVPAVEGSIEHGYITDEADYGAFVEGGIEEILIERDTSDDARSERGREVLDRMMRENRAAGL